MKILISADMEGATGVTWPADVLPGTPQWERCRSMFTSDVNAAVLGFFDGGADEVLINEAHWSMRNLLLERLDDRAEMLTGRHKSLSMVEGVQHGDVDGDRLRRLPHGSRHGGRPRAHLPRQLHHRRLAERRPRQRGAAQRPCRRRVRRARRPRHRRRPDLRGRASDTPPRRARSPSRTMCRGTRRCAAPRPVPPPTSVPPPRRRPRSPVRHEPVRGGPFTVELEFDAEHLAAAATVVPGVARERGAAVAYTSDDHVRGHSHLQGGHDDRVGRGGGAVWLR